MITSLDKITVNTPEEYFNAFNQGYSVPNIECDLDDEELFNYFNENKNNSPENMFIYAYMLSNGKGTEIDYKNAMIYAKKSADYGNYVAMNFVGYMYDTGMGVETDYNIAFEYYKRAAAMGSSVAHRNLGLYYRKGRVVAKNLEKALEYYKKAEELGNLHAIVSQGDVYFDIAEYDTAFSLYKKSAELGISDGYFRLAYMMSDEKYGRLDYERAVYYYKKVIEKNNDYAAMNNLGLMYEKGNGVSQSYEKAFEYYSMSAQQNNSYAFYNLGFYYENGTYVEKNVEKSLECFKKAEELGCNDAIYQQGRIYEENEDYEKALSLYEKSAELGISDGYFRLAYMMSNEKYGRLDYEKAVYYYKKTIEENNDSVAMNNLALMYEKGNGVSQSYEKAFEYYSMSAQQNNSYAFYNLGFYYENGTYVEKNVEKSLECFKKAEELGCNDAIYQQGRIYEENEDYEKASSLYEKSVELGIFDGYFRLAHMMSNEKYGRLDYEKAVRYFEIMIAEKNDCDSMLSLALMYFKGKGVKKDNEKVFELFSKAAESKNSLSLYNLGACYLNGIGTDVNYQKALELFLQSCENGGYSKTYKSLYKIYNEGLGVPKDIEKAKYYRNLALDSNNLNIIVNSAIDYTYDLDSEINDGKATNKLEAQEKLFKFIELIPKQDTIKENYVLAEIYYLLSKIDLNNFMEYNKKAVEYAKKSYEMSIALVNKPMFTKKYGEDFFDFNTDFDYMVFDEASFNSQAIHIFGMSVRPNNYSIDFWILRSRLAYAMYCEYEEIGNVNKYYKKAMSLHKINLPLSYKDVVYPNAMYMFAIRCLMGYGMDKNEEYAIALLRHTGERYHSRGAFLYGKNCELKGDFNEASTYYSIAISNKYVSALKREQHILYGVSNVYEYGGEKKPCYEALNDLILNFDKYDSILLNIKFKDRIFEDYLNASYEYTNVNKAFEMFERYGGIVNLEKFIEKYLDKISSLEAFISMLKSNKKATAFTIFDNIINSDNVEAIKKAREVAIRYGIYTEVESKTTQKLIDLGDGDTISSELIKNISDFNDIPTKLVELAKAQNQIALGFFNENYDKSNTVLSLGVEIGVEKCLEKYSLMLIEKGQYEKAMEINPNLSSHSIWGYLLYGCNEDALPSQMREALRLLRLPTELDARESAKEIDTLLILNKRRMLNNNDVDRVISYANKKKEYLKSGIYLVSQGVVEGFLLLTKHYMSNTDNLLKLCETVLLLQGGYIDKNVYSFNKAMCLLSKGGFFNKNKAKSILNELVTLKHHSALEKLHMKPYQPAIDFLGGKEVNEEYLLNIKNKEKDIWKCLI